MNGTIQDECNFLRAYLQEYGCGEKQVVKPFTLAGLQDRPVKEMLQSFSRNAKIEMPNADPATITDFIEKNESPYPIDPEFLLDGRLLPVPPSSLEAIFCDQDGWKRFNRQYPQSRGILGFSRIGFNAGLDEALLYIENQSHWLSGSGDYFLLRKTDGKWVRRGGKPCWLS